MSEKYTYDYCIVDADSLIYNVAYTDKSPAVCQNRFDNSINSIIKNCDSPNSIVYIKGDENFRVSYEATYKSNRKDNLDPDVKERVKALYEHAKSYCVESDGGEADDYVTAMAKECRDKGVTYVIAHIDKDLNCIPGWHYNFRTGSFTNLYPEEAYLFMMQQMITGDATDGIKGIYGMGPVKAGKYLENVAPAEMLRKVFALWESKKGRTWKEEFTVCSNLIYLRDDLEDIRPLTFEEMEQRLTWKPTIKNTDLGLPYPNNPEETNEEINNTVDVSR